MGSSLTLPPRFSLHCKPIHRRRTVPFASSMRKQVWPLAPLFEAAESGRCHYIELYIQALKHEFHRNMARQRIITTDRYRDEKIFVSGGPTSFGNTKCACVSRPIPRLFSALSRRKNRSPLELPLSPSLFCFSLCDGPIENKWFLVPLMK